MQLFRSFSFTPFFGMAPSLYICFFDTVSFIVPLFFFFFFFFNYRLPNSVPIEVCHRYMDN